MEIEVFRAGTVRDSSGQERHYSEADLDAIAAIYNQRVASDYSEMAPIVKGHPKDNAPALGWTKYLKRSGDKLIAAVKDICPEFMEELIAGRYRRVSISLYPDKMLRHIGFLGAAAPAVRNLKPAEFNENGADNFSEDSIDNTTENKDAEVEFSIDFAEMPTDKSNAEVVRNLELRLSECLKTIEKYEREKRVAEFKEYCSKQSQKLTMSGLQPIVNEYMPEFMEMAYQLDSQKSNENTEPNYSGKVKELIANFSQLNLTEDFVGSMDFATELTNNFSGKNVRPERIEKHRRAMEILRANPNLTYEEAANSITN